MGSSHLNLSFSSGEMRVFVCFLVAVIICCAAKVHNKGRSVPNKEPKKDEVPKGAKHTSRGRHSFHVRKSAPKPGKQGANQGFVDYEDYGDYGSGIDSTYYNWGCCAVKAVEMNDTAVEMFALMEAYPYYEMPNFCNSWCVYVKMSELKPIMDQMNNITMEYDYDYTTKMKDDSDMMENMLGKEQWMMMKLRMEVQKLQKYCFKDSEDAQAMCADPNMYMDVFQMIMNGLDMGGMDGGMGSGDHGYGEGGMGSGGYGYTEGGMGSGDYGYTTTGGME